MSEDVEKILFLLLVFLMISHFIGCIWILIADMSVNAEKVALGEETNWIISGGYQDDTMGS